MGILSSFTLGMMLAVNRRPFLGDHTGAQPEPGAKEVRHQRVQIKCSVRLMAVEINRDASNRDVGRGQGEQNDLPPRPVKQAGVKKAQNTVEGKIRKQINSLNPNDRTITFYPAPVIRGSAAPD